VRKAEITLIGLLIALVLAIRNVYIDEKYGINILDFADDNDTIVREK